MFLDVKQLYALSFVPSLNRRGILADVIINKPLQFQTPQSLVSTLQSRNDRLVKNNYN